MNIALLQGRAGSKSIHNKNVYPIMGKPLTLYPILAAKAAEKVDDIYVTTNCELISAVARAQDIKVIDRPEEICKDDSDQVEAYLHALSVIPDEIGFLVLMKCNCAIHCDGLIDQCIRRLEEDPEADSCVTGVIDKGAHPFRTKQIGEDGYLAPWLDVPTGTSANRQSLSGCVVLDGAARVLRVSTCFPPYGDPPYTFLGKKILFVENPYGRDIDSMYDVVCTEHYLRQKEAGGGSN